MRMKESDLVIKMILRKEKKWLDGNLYDKISFMYKNMHTLSANDEQTEEKCAEFKVNSFFDFPCMFDSWVFKLVPTMCAQKSSYIGMRVSPYF